MKKVWTDQLDVELDETNAYPCLRLLGAGERTGAERFTRMADELIEAGHTQIILDARSMRFLDPECVTAIEAVVQRLAGEGGGLVIVDRCAPVERALKLMGLEQLTHVVPSLPEAVRYLEW
jgi:anti-anti-sigma regulatory factor